MHIIRMVTVYEPEVDELPPELREVLTERDVAAIRTGPEYFATLAGEDSPEWLREVLAQCAENSYHLQFLSSGDEPYRPYYRFFWQGLPAVSLPRGETLRADMPDFLRHIYSVIGAFRENGFDEAGGLLASDSLVSVEEMGLGVSEDGGINPDEAIPFLETFSGDQLCYLIGGGGAWLRSCEFNKVEDLEEEVAQYFRALLDGTRI